jgi:hypothetical protein
VWGPSRKAGSTAYPIYVAFETGEIRFVTEEFGIESLEDLVERILDDAYYFKKGVAIYFEHLAPYFARHSLQRKAEGLTADENVVTRIRKHIAQNIHAIEDLRTLNRTAKQVFPNIADLETLRSAIALELSLTVLSERFDESTVQPYLRSVRLLKHQLFSNFNTLVLVHQHRIRRAKPG